MSSVESKGRAVSRLEYTMCVWRGHQPPHFPPGSKELIGREVADALLISFLYRSCTRTNAILSFEQCPSIQDIFIATLAAVMAIRNRQGQGQGHPEGSEEGTPTTPQTKGENQRAANAGEALGYTGNKCSTRMGTARGWTQAG